MHGPKFIRGTTAMAKCEGCSQGLIVTKLLPCEACDLWMCPKCWAEGDHDGPDEHHHTRNATQHVHRSDP